MKQIEQRFLNCGLEIHPEKSGIIYCKDKNRRLGHERISFDFLGYTFRPRRCVNGKGLVHPNFLPAISRASKKAIHQEMRSWHIQIKNDKSLIDLAKMFNPILVGWWNYYSRFYPSQMRSVGRHFNDYLVQWVRRKYQRYARHKRRARNYLNRLAHANPHLFIHWKHEIFPGSKVVGAG